MAKLTDMKCRQAKCDGQKIMKLGDGEGLYLWVFDTGKKMFHLRYKFDGKQKGIHLGEYPELSLTEARKEARRQRELLDAGLDPSAERMKASARQEEKVPDNSFAAIGREWFAKTSPGWSQHHADDVRRRLEVNIFPEIGHRPIDQIDGPELLRAINKIEDRGATDLAHRVNGNCGQIFRFGIAKGVCKFDIAASITDALTPHVKSNQASVHPREIPRLMRAIGKYHEVGFMQTEIGLKLLAHTFTRTTELICARWSEFDIEQMLWTIPAERMKLKREHLVPLSPQVVGYLKQLEGMSRGSEYILPGRSILKPTSNNALLYALYRLGYKDMMTGHGFRAMASTVLNEEGWDVDWVEKQLAHEPRNKVRGAYNRAQYLKGRRQMMNWWSDYLEAVEQGKKPPHSPYAA